MNDRPLRQLDLEARPGRTLKIAVAMGGPSRERAVSLHSGTAIAEALVEQGHDVRRVVVAGPGELLRCRRSDVVFPAFHGPYGEDGGAQAELESLGLPYVGSGVRASRLAMDKHRTKVFLSQRGVPVAPWFTVSGEVTAGELEQRIDDRLSWPVVLKPRRLGSSIGVRVVRSREQLDDALEQVRETLGGRDDLLVEEFVEGHETTAGVLLEQSLPIVGLAPAEGQFFDYRAKYDPESGTEYRFDTLTDEEEAELSRLALRCHRLLSCRDLSRSDFILRETGEGPRQPIFLETNTIPGFTATSLVPKAARALGIPFEVVCEQLCTRAWRRGSSTSGLCRAG